MLCEKVGVKTVDVFHRSCLHSSKQGIWDFPFCYVCIAVPSSVHSEMFRSIHAHQVQLEASTLMSTDGLNVRKLKLTRTAGRQA